MKEPEDEIVAIEPYYPVYFAQNPLTKNVRRVRSIPQTYDPETNSLKINFEIMEKSVNENTKLLLLCNPCNPTTRIYSKEEYEQITAIIQKYPRIRIMEDNAYFPYLVNDKRITYFASIGDNYHKTISVFSAGKVFAVTGMRLGFGIGSKENIDLIQTSIGRNHTFSSPFEQMVFAKNFDSATQPYENCENYWDYVAEDTKVRYHHLNNILAKYGLHSLRTDGTYYIVFNVSHLRGLIPEEFFYTARGQKKEEVDKAFCRMMLKEGIGVVPLSAVQQWDVKMDYFVRICANRTFLDFEKVDEALSNVMKKMKI
jgi:aspartate/methionine/tyrosine aminotransferase